MRVGGVFLVLFLLGGVYCGCSFAAQPRDEFNKLISQSGQYLGQMRFEEAESSLKKALAIAEKSFGPADDATAGVLGDLGFLYLAMGRGQDAIENYQKAIEIAQGLSGGRAEVTATYYKNIGDAYLLMEQFNDAVGAFQKALSMINKGEIDNGFVRSIRESYSKALERVVKSKRSRDAMLNKKAIQKLMKQ
ncbi:MAG: tetratricopeptide repeat protein [Candidatus Omnitrophica bacterium]|nr:tetratricopeptide repeat protein [Candidatus Omnitrophota bacterium]